MKFFRPGLLAAAVTLRWVAPALAEGDTGKEYLLTHKSSYAAEDGGRNPFWPIGFKPAPPGPDIPQAAPVEAIPEVHPESFVVTTISLEKDAPLAVINGRTHGVGDRLPVDASGKQFVTIKQIVDGAVIFDFHGQSIRSVAGRRGGR